MKLTFYSEKGVYNYTPIHQGILGIQPTYTHQDRPTYT